MANFDAEWEDLVYGPVKFLPPSPPRHRRKNPMKHKKPFRLAVDHGNGDIYKYYRLEVTAILVAIYYIFFSKSSPTVYITNLNKGE